MSNQQPGHDWQTPPAGAPHGGHVPGYPAPPAGGGSPHRGAWIGAGATMLAAVVTLVGAYLLAPDNSSKAAPAPAPPAADAVPGAAGTATPAPGGTDAGGPSASSGAQAPAAAPSAPAGKAAGTVRWEGPLAIAFADDKDLDPTPPANSQTNADNDFGVFDFAGPRLRPERGAKALLWETEGSVPSYADCASAVATQATSEDIAAKAGMVVCALTNDGRVARLRIKQMNGDVGHPKGTFDVTVWNKA
ncbi:hypothetical protein [Streptomyces sp. NPDC048272]|uniref:hypothetical protein n=1 Tax=Streptomyces sp. NPDC048272 TaxID=3154616 RepID=UPI0033DEF118